MTSRSRLLPLLICLALCLPSIARAHQPYCEFADLTASAPWMVPDPSISYAYFGSVYPAGDIDYYTFTAAQGQSILLSLSIPAIPDHEVFSPVLAVYGPGLAGERPPQLPAEIALADGDGALMIPLGQQPRYWFEPFGRRYYWNWDDFFLRAPRSARYTVALWHPLDEIGRYSFVIGQREVFGGEADCFASYGEYWTPLIPGQSPYRDHSAVMNLPAENAPTVDVRLTALAAGGYNLRAQTTNFTFTPWLIDSAPVANEGHAHLYVDGVKTARLYGEWFFIDKLPADAESLTVTLYANDHSAFAVDGVMVADTLSLADLAPAAPSP